MEDNRYEELAKQKIKYLKQTQSLIPFQEDDFVFLDSDNKYLEQSVFVQLTVNEGEAKLKTDS